MRNDAELENKLFEVYLKVSTRIQKRIEDFTSEQREELVKLLFAYGSYAQDLERLGMSNMHIDLERARKISTEINGIYERFSDMFGWNVIDKDVKYIVLGALKARLNSELYRTFRNEVGRIPGYLKVDIE